MSHKIAAKRHPGLSFLEDNDGAWRHPLPAALGKAAYFQAAEAQPLVPRGVPHVDPGGEGGLLVEVELAEDLFDSW